MAAIVDTTVASASIVTAVVAAFVFVYGHRCTWLWVAAAITTCVIVSLAISAALLASTSSPTTTDTIVTTATATAASILPNRLINLVAVLAVTATITVHLVTAAVALTSTTAVILDAPAVVDVATDPAVVAAATLAAATTSTATALTTDSPFVTTTATPFLAAMAATTVTVAAAYPIDPTGDGGAGCHAGLDTLSARRRVGTYLRRVRSALQTAPDPAAADTTVTDAFEHAAAVTSAADTTAIVTAATVSSSATAASADTTDITEAIHPPATHATIIGRGLFVWSGLLVESRLRDTRGIRLTQRTATVGARHGGACAASRGAAALAC
jgi:hypothetical protein